MLKLSSPWMNYYKAMKAFFDKDPDVRVVFDEQTNKVNVYVEDEYKAVALDNLLIPVQEFGNITIRINVIPANGTFLGDVVFEDQTDLIKAAFKYNDAVDSIKSWQFAVNASYTYVLFKDEVVHYFNDDLSSYTGHAHTLMQNIGDKIMKMPSGVFLDTVIGKNSTMANKSWP